jgi:hypothetical protein
VPAQILRIAEPLPRLRRPRREARGPARVDLRIRVALRRERVSARGQAPVAEQSNERERGQRQRERSGAARERGSWRMELSGQLSNSEDLAGVLDEI